MPLIPVTTGRPRARATRMPTWNPPASADSLPNRMRSKAPPASSSAVMAATSARAVACASGSGPSTATSTARSTPTETAYRSCSSASGGPRVSTVLDPPCCSTRRMASSTAHSSCGLVVKPRFFVSMPWLSGVSVMRAPGAGTRLTHARTRRPSGIGGQRFIRASSGSNSGVLPATATRTGNSSAMYITRSSFPTTACSGGR